VSLELNGKKRSIGFHYAWNGILYIIKTERNFRIHLVCGFLAVAASVWLDLKIVEWALIVLVIGLVLLAELVNSAIEMIIDYLKPEIHPSAEKIKDAAAGAVLVAAIAAVVVGAIIFIPNIILLF